MAEASPQSSPAWAGGLDRAAPGEVTVRRALLSVSDKTGILDFARGLLDLGVELVSTGGTARELADAGLPVRAIEDFTGFPEMMDGRVKTLHPRLYAGLLAVRDDDEHLRAAAEQQIEQVDLVCVNLYPFEQTLARGDASEAEIIENIDIGGPTMIRAAAKNHPFAAVLVDSADYGPVLEELRRSERRLSAPTRRRLAAAAFACTARYDAAISGWFESREGGPGPDGPAAGVDGAAPDAAGSALEAGQAPLPAEIDTVHTRLRELRYGENPHQRGAFYARAGAPTHLLAGVEQLHGKELSFNNLLDLSSARELLEEFSEPACVIVKHNNPCGCALGADPREAYERAFACDPQSAFGGVIAINRAVDRACAESIVKQFVEVLLAPSFEEGALEVLTAPKNLRLLAIEGWSAGEGGPAGGGGPGAPREPLEMKAVIGGLLVQDRDRVSETREQMRVVSAAPPSEEQWRDMLFAWVVCRHVRSNAIVIVRDRATLGIGAGQMSRVDSVRIAVEKARSFQPDLLPGSSLASDAFFPFADGPELALQAGIAAIIQPGGSIRDADTVEAVDRAGAAMVATAVRHFRH